MCPQKYINQLTFVQCGVRWAMRSSITSTTSMDTLTLSKRIEYSTAIIEIIKGLKGKSCHCPMSTLYFQQSWTLFIVSEHSPFWTIRNGSTLPCCSFSSLLGSSIKVYEAVTKPLCFYGHYPMWYTQCMCWDKILSGLHSLPHWCSAAVLKIGLLRRIWVCMDSVGIHPLIVSQCQHRH